MSPVFRVEVGIPVHTGLGAGLRIPIKRGHHLFLIEKGVDIKIIPG